MRFGYNSTAENNKVPATEKKYYTGGLNIMGSAIKKRHESQSKSRSRSRDSSLDNEKIPLKLNEKTT